MLERPAITALLVLNAEISAKLGTTIEAVALYDEALALHQALETPDAKLSQQWQAARLALLRR